MNTPRAQLTFYGGVGSVTGANFMLTSGDTKILVDCGMFQGRRMCDDGNYHEFPYDIKAVTALVITHSHIDHVGRIPKLVKDGYTGPIYSTPQTKALASVMLDDAAKLVGEEAKACGTVPPYTPDDVPAIFNNWKEIPYYTPFQIGDIKIEFFDAGHILGSALVVCTHPVSGKIVFSGDLGNSPSLLLRDTDTITDANYMVIESVYGDRAHEPEGDRSAHLEDIIERVIAQKGTLLIPAFSVERTQLLLYEINNLVETDRIPPIPVYLDSPLAIKVTEIYRRNSELFNDSSRAAIKRGDDIFKFEDLSFIPSNRESKTLEHVEGPKIIIAGSGMSHGGRILSHEKLYLPDPKNVLLIVGYQAPGSIGRQLMEGATSIDIKGDITSVKARIETILGFSGHRDVNGLLSFVENTHRTLKKLFVTMGEPKASQFFAQRVRDYMGVDAVYPELGETVEL
jgi:metallo-beta-lactamase family protein